MTIEFHKSSSWYKSDYISFVNKMGDAKGLFPINKNMPCLNDKSEDAGFVNSHYFIQDLYFAQKVFQNNPMKHVDVGSRVDGFVAHVASFRENRTPGCPKIGITSP